MNKIIKAELGHQMKRIVILLFLGVITLASTVSVAALSRKVQITDGTDVKTIVTMSKETDKILAQAGIVTNKDDLILRDDESYDYIDIEIKRAFDVWVSVDGFSKKITFNCGTVKDVCEKANVNLSEVDTTEPELDTLVTFSTNVEVIRRCNVNLTVDGEIKQVAMPFTNVAEGIEYAGVALGDDDIVNFERDKQIVPGMNIVVKRVGYREQNYVEKIPYGTIISVDEDLNEGQTKIISNGVNGEKVVVKREKIVDGEIVESTIISTEITKEAISEKKLVGIKRSSKSTSISQGNAKDNGNGTLVDHFGNTISYKSVLTGSGTAYTAAPGAVTSTGKTAKVGYVAVNPKTIPYGTKLYITSSDGKIVYGYAIAADTGGALMSGRALVDLYYNTLDECYKFGRREVKVYILS